MKFPHVIDVSVAAGDNEVFGSRSKYIFNFEVVCN